MDLAVEGKPAEMTAEEFKIFKILRAFVEREELPEVDEIEVEKELTATENTGEKTPAGVTPEEAYIITVDLPTILGPDMREYGPFKAWDMAVLPEEIGRVLTERNVALRVKLSL